MAPVRASAWAFDSMGLLVVVGLKVGLVVLPMESTCHVSKPPGDEAHAGRAETTTPAPAVYPNPHGVGLVRVGALLGQGEGLRDGRPADVLDREEGELGHPSHLVVLAVRDEKAVLRRGRREGADDVDAPR